MPAQSVSSICLFICTAILSLAALMYAEPIAAPLLLALVVGIILSPISDMADKVGIPRAVSAFATMAFGLVVVVSAAFLLEPSIRAAIEKAPVLMRELESTLQQVRAMMQGLDEMAKDVSEAIEPDETPAPAESGDDDGQLPVPMPQVTDAVIYAPGVLAQFMTFMGVLYFFLLVRTDVYRFAGRTLPRLTEQDLTSAERQVAQYFLTITMINASFGVIVATVMSLLGMPSPMLFGVLAFALNYILYLGPAILLVALLLTGITVFDGAMSVVPAGLYLAMNATEAQFVTPTFVGKRMSVNPLLVFLSLVFWLWLWGPVGGFIAIPLLVWVLSLVKSCDVIPDAEEAPALKAAE
ncbi:putative PurR-regulated permease PerM [Litoreibacter ponti]|uniref:Putative PurR-regulated permease PerM n=1 Tax=Litoreibacter ponti TaxID=1510457 RepID=A0A2T6BLY4_9RHOB|nr:AI-2E family transporter [Litoreibacter ponti]PTX57071.1 putative PurR-regulated permease PerM [Litoreibacter ponti]